MNYEDYLIENKRTDFLNRQIEKQLQEEKLIQDKLKFEKFLLTGGPGTIENILNNIPDGDKDKTIDLLNEIIEDLKKQGIKLDDKIFITKKELELERLLELERQNDLINNDETNLKF
jgi:hypothetical protein